MSGEKQRKFSREFRVTVTVEELKAPKVADVSVPDEWSSETEEFLEEADYSMPESKSTR